MTTERKPHVHATFIKAWADGAQIQFLNLDGEWVDVAKPNWAPQRVYRIKPEPKADIMVVHYLHLLPSTLGMKYLIVGSYGVPSDNGPENKVLYTFDGETGKVKGVKLL
ncbi:MAG: hypothetical protein ACK5QX_11450 [bacterium]|jgi:hypothetical protein